MPTPRPDPQSSVLSPHLSPACACATPHPLAANAARQIFAQGGNAIDAAVAAMFTVCVVIPSAVGIGGYGGSLVAYLADRKKVVSIDFDARAPGNFDPARYTDPRQAQFGPLSVTVPAVLAGLTHALARYGTLPLATILQPAIAAAEAGFPVDDDLRRHIDRFEELADQSSKDALFHGQPSPKPGDTWRLPQHAALLKRIAKEGPRILYQGPLANQILAHLRENGSPLTEEDFSHYQPTDIEPLHISYRGYDLYTPPPPSGGITTLQTLKTLEQFDLPHLSPASPEFFHLFAQASQQAWQSRAKHLGDPDFVNIPYDQLLSEQTAKQNAARIRNHALPRAANSSPAGNHTANICAHDPHGNLVSVTATHGYLFGSKVIISPHELVLGHGMSRFDFTPNHPNAPAPNKRMHHNMSPLIILKDNQPFAAMGLPGGPKIISVTTQLATALIDFHLSPHQAVALPRAHTEAAPELSLSNTVPPPVIDALRAKGHPIRIGQDVGGPAGHIGGQANVILLKNATPQAASGKGKNAAFPP